MNGRETHGMPASGLSVAKLPYDEAQEGISLTATVLPTGLGHTPRDVSGAVPQLSIRVSGYAVTYRLVTGRDLAPTPAFVDRPVAVPDPAAP